MAKGEAGTPPVSREVPASLLAGCAGLEPAASGVTVGEVTLGDAGQASQPVANAGSEPSPSGPIWSRFAAFLRPFGIPLVSVGQIDGASVRWVSVRELAGILRVSPSTVYQAVATAQVPHVRVSNAIRVAVPRGISVESRAGPNRGPR